MKLIDANILIYAFARDLSQHLRAKSWLDAAFQNDKHVGLPWESTLGFLRIVTHRRVFSEPATVKDAWRQVRLWLDLPNVEVVTPVKHHEMLMDELIATTPQVRSVHIPDLHLAAIAIGHGMTLCSADVGFQRIAGLRWINPVAD